jgi:hypothetical protein
MSEQSITNGKYKLQLGRGQAAVRSVPELPHFVLLPDEGYRYQETIYNDEWLRSNNLLLNRIPDEPRLVDHPEKAGPEWSRFIWGRRRYEQVMRKSFTPQEQLCTVHG